MFSNARITFPGFFTVSVVLYLFWALWQEFSIADTLYIVGVFGSFIYGIFILLNNKWSVYFSHKIMYISLWIVFMFMAYNTSEYSLFQRTVKFFGVSMDTHSRIMVYMFLILIPGMVFSEVFSYTSGKFFKVLVFSIIVTSLIFSLRAVIFSPDAIRARLTTEQMGNEEILWGTPSYSIIYSLPIIVPWFLSKRAETKSGAKLFYTAMAAMIILLVAISQFATAFVAL